MFRNSVGDLHPGAFRGGEQGIPFIRRQPPESRGFGHFQNRSRTLRGIC